MRILSSAVWTDIKKVELVEFYLASEFYKEHLVKCLIKLLILFNLDQIFDWKLLFVLISFKYLIVSIFQKYFEKARFNFVFLARASVESRRRTCCRPTRPARLPPASPTRFPPRPRIRPAPNCRPFRAARPSTRLRPSTGHRPLTGLRPRYCRMGRLRAWRPWWRRHPCRVMVDTCPCPILAVPPICLYIFKPAKRWAWSLEPRCKMFKVQFYSDSNACIL